MLENENVVKNADIDQIKTMLIYCIRGERFCDGFWGGMITGGNVRRLLQRLAERMPCGTFKANAVFFRLGILSYNLFVGFKRLCCPKDWHTHTVKTFRWRLFNTAGQVVRHARQVIVRLKIDRELLRVFEYISYRIDMLRMDLSS